MEDAGHPRGLARLDAERHDVLDLEVDGVADLDAVAQPVLADLDRRALRAEVLAHERPERLHRAAELPAEDGAELRGLLLRRGGVDEDPEAPVAVGHHLRRVGDSRDLQAADVGALDVTVDDVEDERDAAPVVVRPERQRRGTRTHHLA